MAGSTADNKLSCNEGQLCVCARSESMRSSAFLEGSEGPVLKFVVRISGKFKCVAKYALEERIRRASCRSFGQFGQEGVPLSTAKFWMSREVREGTSVLEESTC